MFYLFTGPDEYSAHEELARLRASGSFEHNVDTFDGATAEIETIRTLCETYPFLSERRLVIVEGLPKRKRASDGDDDDDEKAELPVAAPTPKGRKAKGATGKSPKAFAEGLAACATSLPETTVFVVLLTENLEATHPLMKAAKQGGQVKTFRTPGGAQLEDWIRKRARDQQATIEPDAVRELIGAVGEETRVLASEITKLATYVGSGGTIRVQDVRLLTPTSHETKAFDLTDALARRDRSRALALLHELLASNEPPLRILGLVAFQTRALMQIKALNDRGMRALQIAQTAGLAPFVVEKSLPLARQFTMAELEAAHRSLLEVDTALKRSRMTPEMALDLLVLEFGRVASSAR